MIRLPVPGWVYLRPRLAGVMLAERLRAHAEAPPVTPAELLSHVRLRLVYPPEVRP